MLLPVADSGVQWPQHIRVGSEEHQTNWQDPLLSLPQCLCLGRLCEFMPACCLYWLVPRSSRIWTISRTQYQSVLCDSISIHVLGLRISLCSGTWHHSIPRTDAGLQSSLSETDAESQSMDWYQDLGGVLSSFLSYLSSSTPPFPSSFLILLSFTRCIPS